MALYDARDLVDRCIAMALRPALDERMDDERWCRLLSDAQEYWMAQIAVHAPEINYVTEQLTSLDGGVTFTLSSPPMGHAEILPDLRGSPLTPGPFWSPSADFCPQGQTIRMCMGRARTFADGPWARYVPVPPIIHISGPNSEPVMLPVHMRALLVPRAVASYASQGGVLDPAPYIAEEQRLWCGDPRLSGDTGFLGQLKTTYFNSGAAAIVGDSGDWYRNADFGVGRP